MATITVSMHEAKTTLSQLVKKAAEGHEVIISSNGKPSFDDLPDGFDVLTR